MEDEETLDRILEWGRQGLTYTDAGLRDDLSVEDKDRLDQVLEWTREGFTYTDADLRELATGEEETQEAFEQFDQTREWLGLARSLLFLLFLLPGVLLVMIGFLGGRRWTSRVAWAAVALGIVAGIVYAAFGPAYHGVAKPFADDRLDERLAEATRDATVIEQLVAEKGVDVARTAIGDFVGWLESWALLLLIISIVVLGLTILWPGLSWLMRGGQREEPEQPDLGPEAPGMEEFEQAGPEPEAPEQEERGPPGATGDEEPNQTEAEREEADPGGMISETSQRYGGL